MKFLFTCGGTAGHINPALAVAGNIKRIMPESEFLFVGAEGKMETELVPRAGYEIKTIKITNMQRKISPTGFLHNLNSAKNLAFSLNEAGKIIAEFKPDVAIGTGGYVCYPVLRKAGKMEIPTVIHESNAVPGLTTKMLEDRVTQIMIGFADSRKEYKKQKKVVYTGTPVRGEFLSLSKENAREKLGLHGKAPLVVSFWGSLGASNMNRIIGDFIKENYFAKAFCHIHATGGGDGNIQKLRKSLMEKGVVNEQEYGIDIREYIYDMPTVMAAADLILCRAGASTLSELTVLGKPAILVPSPNVTNNHQEKNARVLEEHGAACLFRETELTGKLLYETTQDLLNSVLKLEGMSKAMKSLGVSDSADKMTGIILELLKS